MAGESSVKSEDVTGRGQDWEVVSLTASTYAAAPGPKSDEKSPVMQSEAETKIIADGDFDSMVLSRHFSFPTSSHEVQDVQKEEVNDNLKICDYPSYQSIDTALPPSNVVTMNPNFDRHGRDAPKKPGFVDITAEFESGQSLLDNQCAQFGGINSNASEDGKAARLMDWIDPCCQPVVKENNKPSMLTTKLDLFCGEIDCVSGSKSSNCDNENILAELNKEIQDQVISLSNESLPMEDTDVSENEFCVDDVKADKMINKDGHLPCTVWWKHHASSLLAQAKEAHALWPIAIATVFVGLVILGQRWQNQQLHSQINAKDEKSSHILYQIARFKDVVTGRRKVPILRSSSY